MEPSSSRSLRVCLGWGQCLDLAARFLGAPHERCATRLIGEPRAPPQLHRRPSFVVLCSRRKRLRGLPTAQEPQDSRVTRLCHAAAFRTAASGPPFIVSFPRHTPPPSRHPCQNNLARRQGG